MPSKQKTVTVAARFQRLVVVFLALTVVTSVFSLYTLYRLRVNGPVSNSLQRQMELMADIMPPPLYLIEPYANALQLLGENDPESIRKADKSFEAAREMFTERRDLWTGYLAGRPEARVLSEDSYRPGLEFFATVEEELMPALRAQDSVTAYAITNGKLRNQFLEHRRATDKLVALVQESTNQIGAAADTEASLRIGLLLVALIGGMAAVWFFSQRVMKTLVGTLKSAAEQLAHGCGRVSAAAAQISASSQNLSSASSEQASSVEETSASLEEMTSMTRATAENAQKAKAVASETRAVTEAGAATMQEMDKTMAEMNLAMEAIESSSGEVAKIVKNIDEIAFQTNILALNAAVEAARAGEAGAGFAVVADEVRSLAQRSAAAAKETADKIEAAIANSRNGSASCRNGATSSAKVGESLRHINDRIAATDSLVAEMATAAREQALGLEQINAAIAQMEQVSQTNASSAEEGAAAAEELTSQAENLNDLVAQLRELVGSDPLAEALVEGSPTASGKRPFVVLNRGQRQPPEVPRPGAGLAPGRLSIPMPKEPAALGVDGDNSFQNF